MELLAQIGGGANDQARQAGMLVGIIMAVVISASIPLAVGLSRGQPLLGVLGAICAIPAAFLLGCLGGLPVAGLFTVIIMSVSGKSTFKGNKTRRRKSVDDYDDDETPRRRRLDRDDDDDYDDDDRPRRRRLDDEDDDYDDRPRRRRDKD